MFRPSRAEIHTMSTALLHRLLHRKPAAPTTMRMNVCPPDVIPKSESPLGQTSGGHTFIRNVVGAAGLR